MSLRMPSTLTDRHVSDYLDIMNALDQYSENFPDRMSSRAMPGFRFDPPLTLKGNIVVRNLDEAVRFIIGYREAHRPELRTSVLHRLEGAAGEAEERAAGDAFRGWAEAEHLIVKLGE